MLFEGIKTAYCPGFEKLLGIACSGIIGNIHYIDACFTKLEDKNKRELTDMACGGSLTELGSYCLLPIIKLFGNKYEGVRFESIHDNKGLDVFTNIGMLLLCLVIWLVLGIYLIPTFLKKISRLSCKSAPLI